MDFFTKFMLLTVIIAGSTAGLAIIDLFNLQLPALASIFRITIVISVFVTIIYMLGLMQVCGEKPVSSVQVTSNPEKKEWWG